MLKMYRTSMYILQVNVCSSIFSIDILCKEQY